MKRRNRLPVLVLVIATLSLLLCSTALADTDGTEPKVTLQPDKLVLQLGTRWAGVEFELRTDAGVFPVPVVVDERGILTMDLGGSTNYTLTCIYSSVPIPDPVSTSTPTPEPIPEPDTIPTPEPPVQTESPQQTAPPSEVPAQPEPPQQVSNEIPPFAIAVFVIGLLAGAGGLAALFLSKRQQDDYDEWEDGDDA